MSATNGLYEEALARRPVLYSARAIMRTPIEQDIPAIVSIAGDWEVASQLALMPYPYTENDARFFLAKFVPAELTWSIIERASGTLIGVIGLTRSQRAVGAVELGYYFARDYWGMGLATEIGAVIAAYGAGLVGQYKLRSEYFADNPASGRVLEKLGFVQLQISERTCHATGGVRPAIEAGFREPS